MSEPVKDIDEVCRERTEEARRDPRSTDELITVALTDPEDQGAWDAITTLHYRATREVLEAARALCASECSLERRVGAYILGQLGVPERLFPHECLAVLARMLEREGDPDVLHSIGVALGHLHHPGAVPLLVPLKTHPKVQVRYAVVFGLSGQGDPRAVEALIKLSADEDEDIRDWATFGLGTQIDLDTPPIREALTRRLDDPDPITRAEAMVGLARRQDPRVILALLEALAPGHLSRFQPRQHLVLEAAAEVGDPRLLPALLRLREESGGEDDSLLGEAIECCRGGD